MATRSLDCAIKCSKNRNSQDKQHTVLNFSNNLTDPNYLKKRCRLYSFNRLTRFTRFMQLFPLRENNNNHHVRASNLYAESSKLHECKPDYERYEQGSSNYLFLCSDFEGIAILIQGLAFPLPKLVPLTLFCMAPYLPSGLSAAQDDCNLLKDLQTIHCSIISPYARIAPMAIQEHCFTDMTKAHQFFPVLKTLLLCQDLKVIHKLLLAIQRGEILLPKMHADEFERISSRGQRLFRKVTDD